MFGERTETDRQTATLNCEISAVWEIMLRVTPRNTSRLLVGPEQVNRTNRLQTVWWRWWWYFAVPLYWLFTGRHSYTSPLNRKLFSIILNFIFNFQSCHVNVSEAGTLGRTIRDLPAVLPYHVTSAVSSSGLSNFDLFQHLKKHLTGRRFAADAEVMQAVTSMLTHTWHSCLLRRNSSVGGRLDNCLNVDGYSAEVWCVPSATHVPLTQSNQNKVFGVRVSVAWFFKLFRWFHNIAKSKY